MAWDRASLRDMFDYTDFTWASYANTVRTLPDGAFAQPVAGSGWGSLRDALFHLALGWDGWAYEYTGTGEPPQVREADIGDWEALQTHRERVRGLLRRALDETPDDALGAPTIAVWPGTPAEHPVSASDILAHILLHERGHHGDISTLFQSLGATPPTSDYLVFTFFRSRKPR